MSGANQSEAAVGVRQAIKIELLCYFERDLDAFKEVLETYPLPETYSMSYHTGALRMLDSRVRFDAVVSPANSYGIMDGGFDDGLSKEFSPPQDYYGLTHVVQKKLWEEWRGFAPPGSCTMVPFSFERYGVHVTKATPKRPWGCRVLAVVPTMRLPQDVRWHPEIVYQCVWSFLCALEKWNANHEGDEKIQSVLMTPLATGVGRIPAKQWASQFLLALRHFEESCKNEKGWSQLSPSRLSGVDDELLLTHP